MWRRDMVRFWALVSWWPRERETCWGVLVRSQAEPLWKEGLKCSTLETWLKLTSCPCSRPSCSRVGQAAWFYKVIQHLGFLLFYYLATPWGFAFLHVMEADSPAPHPCSSSQEGWRRGSWGPAISFLGKWWRCWCITYTHLSWGRI